MAGGGWVGGEGGRGGVGALRWPSGEGVGIKSGRHGFEFPLSAWIFFRGRVVSVSSKLVCTAVATLPGNWVSAGTGWLGVSTP